MQPKKALKLVEAELRAAVKKHPPMASVHEGYAILLEEMDELWDEVKKKPVDRDEYALRAESMQIAAMALRFMTDLT